MAIGVRKRRNQFQIGFDKALISLIPTRFSDARRTNQSRGWPAELSFVWGCGGIPDGRADASCRASACGDVTGDHGSVGDTATSAAPNVLQRLRLSKFPITVISPTGLVVQVGSQAVLWTSAAAAVMSLATVVKSPAGAWLTTRAKVKIPFSIVVVDLLHHGRPQW